MKFTLRFKKINSLLHFFMISFFVFSCGSYQYVGIYEDGIYSDDDSSNQNSSLNTDDYYTDYFKGKAIEYESNDFFTDVESYTGNYNNAENFYSENAGWGQNNDPNVVINIQTRPDYGMFWGWNNWRWNNWGWNNWGWNNWGWNNWGWNNWGYPVFGLYDPYFYNSWYVHNNGFRQNYVHINGHRNNVNSVLGYRSRSLAERSALGTVTKARTRNNRTRSYSNSENYVRFKSNERTKTGSNLRIRNSSNSLYSNDEIKKYRQKNNNQNPKRYNNSSNSRKRYNNSSNSRSRSYNNSRPATRLPATRSSSPRTSSRSRGGG